MLSQKEINAKLSSIFKTSMHFDHPDLHQTEAFMTSMLPLTTEKLTLEVTLVTLPKRIRDLKPA
jgi:hypothetical protein